MSLNRLALLLFLTLGHASGASAQICATPPPGIVGWWPGENSADDHIGANHGTLQNGAGFAAGQVGTAFSLDGMDDYVSLAPTSNLDVGLGSGFTIELWMKPNDVTSQQCIVEWNDGAGGIGVHLWHSIGALGGLGSVFANVSDSSGGDHYIASAPNLLNTLNFQHVALTYDKTSGAAKIFYNGTLVASQNLGVFTPKTSHAVNLGARTSGLSTGSNFNGLLDEVSIYTRGLSEAEVQSIFNAGIAGKCKNEPPTIISQPASRTVFANANVNFNVGASGALLSYQWRFNQTDLPNATNAGLSLLNVQTNQAGIYSVIVSNAFGVVASSNAVLTVNDFCISAPNGLVSWWPANGESFDQINGNEAVVGGGLTYSPGKAGQAFDFDGTNDYASIAASASTDIGSGDGFTIECWIKPEDVSSGHALVEWNTGTALGVQFWTSVPGLGNNGSLFANIVGTNGINHYLASPAGILNVTDFQHVAVTYNRTNGSAKLYRNGSVVASQTIGMFRPQTTYPLHFGKRISGTTPSYYRGLMDEVSLYKRALTEAEILSLYLADTNGKACTPPEILAQPAGKTVFPGSNVTFTAIVRGTAPISAQWKRDGAALPSATNLTLVVSNVQPSLGGVYTLHLTNRLGSAVSSDAVLKVNVVTATGNGQPLTNATHSFSSTVSIQLTNVYPNGLIFYTLDGSQPTFASAQYTGMFVVSNDITLRALGYRADFFESGEMDPITILLPPSYPLTLTSGGGGSVIASPASSLYLSNTVVTLSAIPAAGWTFLKWIGDATGSAGVTNIAMTRPKAVKAVFGTTLSTTAAGGGSVALNPPGGIYPYGTPVQVSAVPNPGSQFALWGNAASGNLNPLLFVLTNASPTISSLFAPVSGGQSALTVVPLGHGQVAVSPRANAYSTGASVTITATPDAGQSFLGWSGDAGGFANPLVTAVNSNRTIFANFTTRPELIATLPSGSLWSEGLQLTILGSSGEAYQLESSTNLLQWSALAYLTNSFGSVQFTDSTATNSPRGFYRAKRLE